ncbi:MAG: hypothetical protein PVF24_10750 [Desulfobacterales bacterium]
MEKVAHRESIELVGLGTNEISTAQMLKAGGNRSASENDLKFFPLDKLIFPI